MIQRTLELSYDRLVIGSDLGALAYCYEHQCPAIYSRVLRPYKYDERENWQRSIAIWDEMAYALSMSQLLPFSDKIVSLRLQEDNILKAVTKYSLVCKIKFNHLVISDDYGVEGLPPPTGKTDDKNWVIDWFDVNRGVLHPLDFIVDEKEDFVKKIYFYPSTRFYKNITKKDLLAVSKISDADLLNNDYDQSIVRLKTIKSMKASGIKGKWDKTNECFLPPKLTPLRRDIYPLGKNIYKDLPSSISMLY